MAGMSSDRSKETGGDRRLICVSVAAGKTGAAGSQAEVIAAAKQAEPTADVIEIRLDSILRPQISSFMEAVDKPLLFTNRPAWEGGAFAGSEEERLAPLLEAADGGAAYVDLELEAALPLRSRLLEAVNGSRSRLIISWHEFKGTPSSLQLSQVLQRQYESGAHIGKIVTTAHDFRDVLRVLSLQLQAAERHFPLIAFCMGRVGVISRLATLGLGGYMTYAAPNKGGVTAPGQVPVSVLREVIMKLSQARER